MKTQIHINKHIIAANAKHGRNDPAITVKTYKENRYTKRVKVGDVEVIQADPENGIKPLNCGAKVWIQVTNPNVEIEIQ